MSNQQSFPTLCDAVETYTRATRPQLPHHHPRSHPASLFASHIYTFPASAKLHLTSNDQPSSNLYSSSTCVKCLFLKLTKARHGHMHRFRTQDRPSHPHPRLPRSKSAPPTMHPRNPRLPSITLSNPTVFNCQLRPPPPLSLQYSHSPISISIRACQ